MSVGGDDAYDVSAGDVQEIGFGAPGQRRGTIYDRPQRQGREGTEWAALDETADGNTARLEIIDVRAIRAVSQVPGEIGGPGVAVTVGITNKTAGMLNLDNVTVDLVDDEGRSASPITMEGYEPFSGDHGPGEEATARYVFAIEPEFRDAAQLRITYAPPPEPTVVFTGKLPRG